LHHKKEPKTPIPSTKSKIAELEVNKRRLTNNFGGHYRPNQMIFYQQRINDRQPDGWFFDQFDQQVFWWQESDGGVLYQTPNNRN